MIYSSFQIDNYIQELDILGTKLSCPLQFKKEKPRKGLQTYDTFIEL